MTIALDVNGQSHAVEPSGRRLLSVLRDDLELLGTKLACGEGACGACAVLVAGNPVNACLLLADAAAGHEIVTIEGLSPNGSHPIQKAWTALDVPQCGFCQSGMIMAAAALLKDKPKPTDADIDAAMTNICRCGTYNRVRAAIKQAASAA